jgi:hypothetical protein
MHMAENEPIFNFMYLRPVKALDPVTSGRDYVHDIVPEADHDGNPPSLAAVSAVASLVSELVFSDIEPQAGLAALKEALLGLLVHVKPVPDATVAEAAGDPVLITGTELERRPYIVDGDRIFLLPEFRDTAMKSLLAVIMKALSTDPPTPVDELVKQLVAFSGLNPPSLSQLVYYKLGLAPNYLAANRELFDSLYLLYMLRRWVTVDLDSIMRAIRALHVLDALAVDELVNASINGSITAGGKTQLETATRYHPQLEDWPGKASAPGIPLIPDAHALLAYWNATPVIHPMFAQLFHYLRPFNNIKPIGIGDLKVVKQKLLAYEPGEISDIHNVMKGESNVRDHRRLEKTEEQFSFSSSTDQESERDSQSTDRTEIKREAENVVKTDIGGNFGTSVTYNQNPVTATVTAGFAASRSGTTTEKSANNFSREVIAKAVDRVAKRTAQQRNTTKTFETEERNQHTFANVNGGGHVSGIYRWVDKRYEAQVYNFGKRMMFEFVIPEPAAFLVEQRLRGFEAALQMPIKPTRQKDDTLNLPFEAEDIDEAMFRELKAKYDLSEFEFPPRQMVAQVLNPENGESVLAGSATQANVWTTVAGKLSLAKVKGYDVNEVWLSGNVNYSDHHDPGANLPNLLVLRADGQPFWSDESQAVYPSWPPDFSADVSAAGVRLTRDDARISVAVQDVHDFQLLVSVGLKLSDPELLDWKLRLHKAVGRIEQNKINAANAEKELAFQSAMTTYNNRLDEIRAVAVNDLLQGKSEAYNRALMLKELKRACLSLLTKEYDADTTDDLLTPWETMGTFDVESLVTRMNVDRSGETAIAEFKTNPYNLKFPAMDLVEARRKAPYIQFLEQAFEWNQLGWVCYPYFWATPRKWIQLIAREDQTDPALSDFLQAGAAKVLVAVTPEYDDAVLHWLAMREPWEGGAAPALGDPLYLPLYDEMHKAQDDLYGGTPVGEPWEYVVPTSLIYLEGSADKLPDFAKP